MTLLSLQEDRLYNMNQASLSKPYKYRFKIVKTPSTAEKWMKLLPNTNTFPKILS